MSRFPSSALIIALIVTAGVAGAEWWIKHATVRYAIVMVQWRGPANEAVARRLSMHAPEVENGIFEYILTDTSHENIAAILATPEFAQVLRLNRINLTADEWETVTADEWLIRRYPPLDHIAGRPFGVLLRRLGLAPVFVFVLIVCLGATPQGRRWMAARVPAITPRALVAFRIAFAISLLVVSISAIGPAWERAVCVILLMSFGFGVAPRVAFAAFVLLFTYAMAGNINSHAWSHPMRTLWLLLLVPWTETRDSRLPQRRLGLAIWIPILMIGISYLAAALSKLDETGISWALHGGIRYFLIEEAASAPSRLGRFVASSDVLSVLLSSGALLIESGVIVAALVPSPAIRLAAGCAALALHAGFYELQGIWWSGWWMLLPAFVPWEWIAERSIVPQPLVEQGERIPFYAGSLIFGVVAIQPIASLLKLDWPPYVSNFPMYSDVQFDSKESYTAFANTVRQPLPEVRFSPPDGVTADAFAVQLSQINAVDPLRMATRQLLISGSIDADTAQSLRRLANAYEQRFGTAPPIVRMVARGWQFDWSKGDFVPRSDTIQADVDLTDGRVSRGETHR